MALKNISLYRSTTPGSSNDNNVAAVSYDDQFHKELPRCVISAYINAVDSYHGAADWRNVLLQYVAERTTSDWDRLFKTHLQAELCPCTYRAFTAKGPNCWVDNMWYSCFSDYLCEVGHSSYYTRLKSPLFAEVVELSPECYRWSRHPISFESLECSARGTCCACNPKITRLTVTCVINLVFVIQQPALRCQRYILEGGENVRGDIETGRIIEHVTDQPATEYF